MTNKVNVIAEIGINHNGDMRKAKDLIDIAYLARCDFVKFQKRNPLECVPESQRNKKRRVPWREEETTYLQYKKDIEFSMSEYEELFEYADKLGLTPFASIWDPDSAYDMSKLTSIAKIPSALITDSQLLFRVKELFNVRMLSTGMSSEGEIERAINFLDPQIIFHTNSIYPSEFDELRLEYITHLKEKYPTKIVGYSNHSKSILPCLASVVLGASYVEVHICENRDDWGTDQSSSIEPKELREMIEEISNLELALTGNHNREILPGEMEKRVTLR